MQTHLNCLVKMDLWIYSFKSSRVQRALKAWETKSRTVLDENRIQSWRNAWNNMQIFLSACCYCVHIHHKPLVRPAVFRKTNHPLRWHFGFHGSEKKHLPWMSNMFSQSNALGTQFDVAMSCLPYTHTTLTHTDLSGPGECPLPQFPHTWAGPGLSQTSFCLKIRQHKYSIILQWADFTP